MLYDKKMFLIKIVQKKGNKKAENKQWFIYKFLTVSVSTL